MLVIAPYEKMNGLNGPNANLAGAKNRKNACNFLTLRKSEWLDRINCGRKNQISGIANRNNRQFSMTLFSVHLGRSHFFERCNSCFFNSRGGSEVLNLVPTQNDSFALLAAFTGHRNIITKYKMYVCYAKSVPQNMQKYAWM